MKCLVVFLSFLFASVSAKALEVSVDCSSYLGDQSPYIEAHIRIVGESLVFHRAADGTATASVELTIFIMDGQEVVSYDRYVLNAPTFDEVKDLIDVKRFAVPAGQYNVRIEAVDTNDADHKVELIQPVTVADFAGVIAISSLQLCGAVRQASPDDPLAKNGVYIEPLPHGVATSDIDQLHIYFEAYREDEHMTYFAKYTVASVSHPDEAPIMKKVLPIRSSDNGIMLSHLPITDLPSGRYQLTVQIMDKSQHVLIDRSREFVRENPAYDEQYWRSYNKDEDNSFVSDMSAGEVEYALRATSPIVYEPKKALMDYMVGEASIRVKRRFLFEFWKEKYPTNTEHHFRQYLTFAKAIDLQYNSNVGYGFETDRGYIFLRYGKPNSVLSIDQEPDSYPYEIWYYHNMPETSQTNVRFIFYNKSLVHNDYTLLHSTCRAERQNPAWELELYGKALDVPGSRPTDGDSLGDGWDRMARKYFNEY